MNRAKRLLISMIALLCCFTGTWASSIPGALSGRFTINASGEKVVFSQGNLQYVGTWQFAENQWDCFSTSQYNDHRDLFGWGTGDAPNKVSNNNGDYGTFTDWGTNAITNGGNTENSGWRTLTKDEWVYLFYSRENAATLFGFGSVNGMNGLIILPDNWTTPEGASFTASTTLGLTNQGSYYHNGNNDNYSHNTYTAEQWAVMESAGAVFLPAAAYRHGEDSNINYTALGGFYWSSTPSSTDKAYYLNFYSNDLDPQFNEMRYGGRPVRLVRSSQIINLSELTEDYIAQDGDVLTGTTSYSVQIAADATITLSNVTITNYRKSPIQCLGNATINIEDGSVNSLRDSDEDSNSYGRPALAFGPSGTTLTINGNTGRLIAIGGRLSSAIGCRDNRVAYGGLIINGGVISAHGNSSYTSGIGAVGADDSHGSSCGDITINGGTINVAASDGVGIGAVGPNSCGAITINGGTITSHAVRSTAIGENCSKVVIRGGDINASTTTGVGIGSSGVVYIEGGTIVASASDWEGVGISGNKGVLIRSSITSLTASKGPYGANAIRGGIVYISANLNDVTEGNTRTLTPKASFDPDTDIAQDGEGYYLIGSLQNWKEFAVLSQIEASPKAKMVADINLGDEQAIIGSFDGLFDGQGHTLTVNLTSTANVCGVFRYVTDGATIQNLRIAGTINGAHRWIGGFVGEGTGTYYINNCISSVTISTTYSGDGVQGGFVAAQRGTLYMNDCIFDGVFNGPNAYTWGGFVGWYYGSSTLTNCLALCDEYNVRMTDVATFIAMSGTLNNCCYKSPIGTAQGTQATAAELADGTTATALQAGRAEIIWVQDPVTNLPMLAIFANGVTLTDGDNLSALETFAGKTCTVAYSRSFTAGMSSTVCLPFAFAKGSVGTFYTFTGISKSGSEYIADMTEYTGDNLEANTPYLFLPSATGNVDFGGTYAIPASLTAGSTVSGDWTFLGTYETVSWTEAPTGIYGFSAQNVDAQGISQGEFVKVGAYVRIKPMRCYLKYDDGNSDYAGARSMIRGAEAEQLPETIKVRLIGANGEVTSIGSLQTKTGEVTFDSDAWYTLEGVQLNGKPTRKGIYVNNGKKVIIK